MNTLTVYRSGIYITKRLLFSHKTTAPQRNTFEETMPISEFEEHRLESLLKKFCDEKGPPAHIRDQLQWGSRIDPVQQTVELFEIRPYFMDASRKIESKFAKAAYVKTSKTWKVYWMRGTGKWTKYDPCPKVKAIEKFLKVVREDKFHCFFG
jgi:hypothetical protein